MVLKGEQDRSVSIRDRPNTLRHITKALPLSLAALAPVSTAQERRAGNA
jgi:hypothetical protein